MDYDEFIDGKQRVIQPAGFEPLEIVAPLFDWQKHVVRWAIRQGRAALFEECGCGKTAQQLEWARQVSAHTGHAVLILTPLAVALQTAQEAAKFGIAVKVVADKTEVDLTGINITNYEKLDHFDLSVFSGVVLDECFAPGTLVECFENGVVLNKDISLIREHDTIRNASGFDRVSECHRRKVVRAVRVTFNGNAIICSENHPWLTRRGWIPARQLRTTDWLLETSKAMRILRDDVHGETSSAGEDSFLREILLSEMAHEAAGILGQGPCSSGCEETRRSEIAVVQDAGRSFGVGTDSDIKPNVQSFGARKSEPHIERDEAQTFRAWRKRDGYDETAIAALGGVTEWMGERVCLITGSTQSRLSHLLQNGFGESGHEDLYRGGRGLASFPERSGCQESRDAGFIRVDNIEILERGHPDLEQFRDANGDIYFYDIGLTRHPSFSVNGIAVHNSSILKAFTGKTRVALTDAFSRTPYRLCCTATPSPNDYTELGQHAAFLGICSPMQMLATFFVNDTFNTGDWRLKKHAEHAFWRWLASWAACISKPSDIGYSDEGYILPPLHMHEEVVQVDESQETNGELFRIATLSATTMHKEMRLTSELRAQRAAELAASNDRQWLIWCNTNDEADHLKGMIPEAREVRGSDKASKKEQAIADFLSGKIRVLISKASIFGFGLNLQCCAHVIFVGLSYSFEDFYQALRRSYRFGQTKEVHACIIRAQTEGAILTNIQRKIKQHITMQESMKEAARAFAQNRIKELEKNTSISTLSGDNWTVHHGDCVRVAKTIPDNSIDFSVSSPPFPDLFVYSDDVQDMGNCEGLAQFIDHYKLLIDEMHRIMAPGREVAVHCVDLLSTKWKHGKIEFQDFSGEIIRAFWKSGFLFHSRICIWKSPVTEMQRTKAHGLLYKTLKADSTDSRVGCADYLLVFRKPGENPRPVTKDPAQFPVDWWQEVASPVWMTVDQGRVLNGEVARQFQDERHICPLQLDVIERAITLWSNPGDLVFSPFTGIGSEGYGALKLGRKFVGAELKRTYFEQAAFNLKNATAQLDLFTPATTPAPVHAELEEG